VRTKSSPLVRKMAAEHGIEITGMQGSGIAGRVTKRDLEAAIAGGVPAHAGGSASTGGAVEVPAQPAIAAAAVQGGPGAKSPANGNGAPLGGALHGDLRPPTVESMPGDVVEPMSRIRQLTAEHMVLSRRWNAHVTSFFEVDLTRVARIRAKQRAEFERATGEKLTFLPFIIKAVTDGLKQYPALNAAVRGTDVVLRKQYNIGIAVALDWGLIVPSSRTPTTCRSPASRASSTTSPTARGRRSCSRPRCRARRSRSPTRACSARSWARRSSRCPRRGSWAWARSRSGRRWSPAPTARTRSPCARAATSRSRSTTASSTAPTRPFMAFVKKSLESFPETGLF
jgi:hypothetical protein